MTLLRKLINLSGCAKTTKSSSRDIIDNNEEACEIIDIPNEDNDTHLLHSRLPASGGNHNYVPWQSPNIARKKILDRVRDSPRVARRMLSKMTSPGVARRKEEIFVVNMQQFVSESGSCCSEAKGSGSKMDSW